VVAKSPPTDHLDMSSSSTLTITTAEGDERTLRHLAFLDSQRPLNGRVLLAQVDGTAVAALSLKTGRVVADPFRRTAAIVAALRDVALAA